MLLVWLELPFGPGNVSCGNAVRLSFPWPPLGFITVNRTKNIPNHEYSTSSARVISRVDAR
jgi:hypothetical protein